MNIQVHNSQNHEATCFTVPANAWVPFSRVQFKIKYKMPQPPDCKNLRVCSGGKRAEKKGVQIFFNAVALPYGAEQVTRFVEKKFALITIP